MNATEQILVIGPSWVGDMVMAQALFKQLLIAQPDARIDVVAPGWSTGILARMPEVRQGYVLEAGHGELALGNRWRLGQELRHNNYTRAIVLPRSFKAALVPWFARVPWRTGFRGELRYGLLNDLRQLDKQRLDQTVKRFLTLGVANHAALPAIQQPELRIDKANQDELTTRLSLARTGKKIAFMPGAAYGPAKMWPLEHFAELARRLSESGHQVWILGSAREHELGAQITATAGENVLNLCGSTSLADTVDLFALADAVVTNDSGLMHVAAAAGTHVVALYGSSSPTFTPPLTEKKTIHHLQLECSPCHQRECPLGHLQCLQNIRPDTVYGSLAACGAT